MTKGVTPRLIEQRLRNRMIEALQGLAQPEAELRAFGFHSYFNDAFDYLERDMILRNSVLSVEERQALMAVNEALELAAAETGEDETIEAFLATGQPATISLRALAALDICLARGRFSEDTEQTEPGVDV